MPDISMCNNNSCPSKISCYRFMAKPSSPYQWYSTFEVPEGKDRCDDFIEAHSKSQLKRLDTQTKEVTK